MTPNQIEQLLSSDAYPEPTSRVFMQQTHISLLFFTDEHVYKVKKPVNLGFLDFSTLEKRHFYCLEELRLNRRLAPDIYLDLVELREDGAGCLRINGPGTVVEYAVKMVRMPEERIMARLLEKMPLPLLRLSSLPPWLPAFIKRLTPMSGSLLLARWKQSVKTGRKTSGRPARSSAEPLRKRIIV